EVMGGGRLGQEEPRAEGALLDEDVPRDERHRQLPVDGRDARAQGVVALEGARRADLEGAAALRVVPAGAVPEPLPEIAALVIRGPGPVVVALAPDDDPWVTAHD